MLYASYSHHATVYLKEFFEAGYNKTKDLLFSYGTKSIQMVKKLGPCNLGGYYGTASYGITSFYFSHPGKLFGDSLKTFEEEYYEEYAEPPPLPYMSNFYDAVTVAGLSAAACKAQNLDVTPINRLYRKNRQVYFGSCSTGNSPFQLKHLHQLNIQI